MKTESINLAILERITFLTSTNQKNEIITLKFIQNAYLEHGSIIARDSLKNFFNTCIHNCMQMEITDEGKEMYRLNVIKTLYNAIKELNENTI